LQYTDKQNNISDGQLLLEFARGLAGGAPGVPRSKYMFDAINLPQVRTGWLKGTASRLGAMVDVCCPSIASSPITAPTHSLPHAHGFLLDVALLARPALRLPLLPACQVVNHLAAQTVILNQDRC